MRRCLGNDASACFPRNRQCSWCGEFDWRCQSSRTMCAELLNNSSNPMCTSFVGVTPLEVRYSIPVNASYNASVWLPTSILKTSIQKLNTNCPHPPDPHACVNFTKRDGWNYMDTHANVDKNMKSFSALITGVRYAWSSSPCCPTIDRNNVPCPPNSCPVHGWNSTLPAAPFFADIVDGKCKCAPPQFCG